MYTDPSLGTDISCGEFGERIGPVMREILGSWINFRLRSRGVNVCLPTYSFYVFGTTGWKMYVYT